MSKKSAFIMSATEVREICLFLAKLANIYDTLGFPEDSAAIDTLIKSLKEKMGGA